MWALAVVRELLGEEISHYEIMEEQIPQARDKAAIFGFSLG